MSSSKSRLLALTALSMASANAAHAATNVYPAANLYGNGASSIANVLVQELNCYGGTKSKLGFNNNTATTIADENYVPVSPTAGNPAYNCATKSVQPNVTGKYVSTGSGGGRSNWFNFVDTATTTNPFESGVASSDGDWGHIQFAFSDAPISSADLTSYNNVAKATKGTGNAIQLPLYVLPIAVAYDPIYGRKRTATGVLGLSFNLKYPHADHSGGLRLSKKVYCGIFNGTITNFNDAAFTPLNGNQSLRDPNDDTTRWNTIGVPIRLVGRLEGSGTSALFSRHLSNVCGTSAATYGYTGPENFTTGRDTLPYDGSVVIPASAYPTSKYTVATGNDPAHNTISGAVFNKTTGLIDTTYGTEAPGKFMVADGNDGVGQAVAYATDPSATIGDVALNGKLAYLGADWVLPSTLSGTGLYSADLQSGTANKYVAATAANATAAFKGVLPPQSAATGKYNPTTPAPGSVGLRNDPLAWVQPLTPAASLANPTAGYPMMGTTNILTYTCFDSAAKRNAMQGFLALHFGKITTDSTGAKIPAKLVSNTGKAADGLQVGILPRNGVAPLPAAFVTAIYETFLTKTVSGANPAALNLWIQDKLPKKDADITSAVGSTTCTTGVGA